MFDLSSAAETSDFKPKKGTGGYCQQRRYLSGTNQGTCPEGEEGYEDAAVDNTETLFDGFIDPSMHLILQKVLLREAGLHYQHTRQTEFEAKIQKRV